MDSEPTWPEHWGPVARRRAADLLFEFLREAENTDPARKHVLRVIGECHATDAVVFEMKGWEAPFAVSHLAWSRESGLGARLKTLVGGTRRPVQPATPAVLHPVQALDDLRDHYPGPGG